MGVYQDVDCPLCGREAILEWHDDGTHSVAVDISDYDWIDVCYTVGDDAADGYIHAFTDRDEAHG